MGKGYRSDIVKSSMSRRETSKLLPDIALPYEEQISWIRNILGVDEEKAVAIRDALESWSNYDSTAIHNEQTQLDNPDLQGVIKTGKEYAKLIDEYLNSPNVPKIKRTLYRDIRVPTSDLNEIDRMLESGVWKGRGITSFSYGKEEAHLYGIPATGESTIHFELRNNRHAAQIGHLSVGGGEKEVLYPSSIKNGIKVISYKKTPIYFDKLDRPYFRETGKKRYKKAILRYEYTVILDDKGSK